MPSGHSVEILLAGHRIRGRVAPKGPWIDFLNDPALRWLDVVDATSQANRLDSPPSVETPHIVVNKDDILVISMLDADARKSVEVPDFTANTTCHMGPFMVQCAVHLGAGIEGKTMFQDTPGAFFVATGTYFSSQIPMPAPLPAAEVALINRAQVRLHLPSGRFALTGESA